MCLFPNAGRMVILVGALWLALFNLSKISAFIDFVDLTEEISVSGPANGQNDKEEKDNLEDTFSDVFVVNYPQLVIVFDFKLSPLGTKNEFYFPKIYNDIWTPPPQIISC